MYLLKEKKRRRSIVKQIKCFKFIIFCFHTVLSPIIPQHKMQHAEKDKNPKTET